MFINIFCIFNFINLGGGNLKKAEAGVGTLIIFIAMILVAAIAASVLIQTATSLQNKALLTGQKSKEGISTGFQPLLVYGTDGSDGSVEELRLKSKLLPGSDPVSLNDTLISVSSATGSLNLEYNGTVGTCTDDHTNSSRYSVQTLIQGSGYKADYVQSGDVIMFCMETPNALVKDDLLQVRVVPRVGQSLFVETTLPSTILTARVFIYP